jgi:hypothetical protein
MTHLLCYLVKLALCICLALMCACVCSQWDAWVYLRTSYVARVHAFFSSFCRMGIPGLVLLRAAAAWRNYSCSLHLNIPDTCNARRNQVVYLGRCTTCYQQPPAPKQLRPKVRQYPWRIDRLCKLHERTGAHRAFRNVCLSCSEQSASSVSYQMVAEALVPTVPMLDHVHTGLSLTSKVAQT